ncbi:DUF1232 domain-containing protein [Streptomyces sp. NPDC055952]|uniref:DUF1232 domain-containing protein n=1 Tax=Streptomyces sp. NPDC055952 TaxID=3345663 RepID=UPI0035D9C385
MNIWWSTALAVVGGLLLLLALAALAVVRPRGNLLTEAIRLLPDLLRLVHRLARDHTLPRGVRLRLWLLLGYLAMPIDLVPDFVPVLGYAGDAIMSPPSCAPSSATPGPKPWRGTGPAPMTGSPPYAALPAWRPPPPEEHGSLDAPEGDRRRVRHRRAGGGARRGALLPVITVALDSSGPRHRGRLDGRRRWLPGPAGCRSGAPRTRPRQRAEALEDGMPVRGARVRSGGTDRPSRGPVDGMKSSPCRTSRGVRTTRAPPVPSAA